MNTDLVQVLGGLGLFLLGMLVMTEGLRGLVGERLNRALARVTAGPLSGAASGAAMTALLQSSSATTVAAVGFVSAGLLTFSQALGVIFGANLGTTLTGWLVALLGLKLQLGQVVFPLILVGALLRLFGRGRWRDLGFALAGFAVLLHGISVLQAGMQAYQGMVTPADFPADTGLGRLQLVMLGIAVTLITQSSSAGVATALTALYTGTISFPQAAALVIGMDVGTTVTAAIATLGGSVDTRRTGYSHVVYNLFTAAAALLMLSPYTWALQKVLPDALSAHGELALVGFHSLFNLVGVLAILPFADRFAALMRRLVPTPPDAVIDRLDRHLLRTPDVALDVVAQLLGDTVRRVLGDAETLLGGKMPDPSAQALTDRHIEALRQFVDQLHLQPGAGPGWLRLNSTIHVLDHLRRLHERCSEEPERALRLAADPDLQGEARSLADRLRRVTTAFGLGRAADELDASAATAERIKANAANLRAGIMTDVAAGQISVSNGTGRLESVRWLRRVSYHLWRLNHHVALLSASGRDAGAST